jgi:hypothetical protein
MTVGEPKNTHILLNRMAVFKNLKKFSKKIQSHKEQIKRQIEVFWFEVIQKIWYYVLQSTRKRTYICNANNDVKESTVFKKVLYSL